MGKPEKVKDPIAVALSAKRMTKMTARRRREVATLGVAARQAKAAENGTAGTQ